MSPYIFTFKSIGFTWFMFLSLLCIVVGYFILTIMGKENNFNTNTIHDSLFLLVVNGFIGARLAYVLSNMELYKHNLMHAFKISHMNLNLMGGTIAGLLTIYYLSKKYKIDFIKLFNIYAIPYYFSIAVVIWAFFFEGILIGREYDGIFSIYHMGKYRHPVVVYLSLLFVIGMLIQILIYKKISLKYHSIINFLIITLLYYFVKHTVALGI